MALAGNGGAEETRTMKWVLGVGLVLLSIGIGTFNAWGAWVRSEHPSWVSIVVGAEVMMFVALGLGVIATTKIRKAACFIITAGLAWFCVQNGKFAVKEMFAEIYETSAGERLDPDTLEAQAKILKDQAPTLVAAAEKAEAKRGDELTRVRREIAELETERDLMLVEISDPTAFNQQVLRAQQSLQARGDYGGNLDGIYGVLTRQAMLSRGAGISTELATLKNEERALNPTAAIGADEVNIEDIGAVAVALTPAQRALAGAAKLEENAKEIRSLNAWGERALWVVEIARSFSVWAFLMTVTARTVQTPVSVKEEDAPEEQPVDPKNDNKPEADPDAPMTREEIIEKSIDARREYREADDATVIEVGPILSTDGRQEDAA